MKLPIDAKRSLRFALPPGSTVSDPLLELELIKQHPTVAELLATLPVARVTLAPPAPPPAATEEELNDEHE